MKMHSRAIVTMALLFLCGSALADCVMRDSTKAEKEYYARAHASLREALPAAPAKWTVKLSPATPIDSVCADDKPGAFELKVQASYVLVRPKEEKDGIYAERRKLEKEIDNLRDLPPDVKKERQVWLDKMSEANRAENAARKAGDKALASQKNKESQEYSAKGRAIRDAYWQRIQPEVDKLEARKESLNDGDVQVQVIILANEQYPQNPPRNTSKALTAGKVPAAAPSMKLQGARLFVVRSQAEGAPIDALADQQKLARALQ